MGTRIRASRAAEHRQYRRNNRDKIRAYKRAHRPEPTILAIDGEGLTRDGVHTYNYLAVCHNGSPVASTENMGCLSTVDCLEAFIDAKQAYPDSILVGFSLGYDYTCILRDLPNDRLSSLYRPESRKGKQGQIKPVRWSGYLLNLLRGRLTVTKLVPNVHRETCTRSDCRGCKRGATATIWDIFGFYQGSFIDACLKWDVITKDEHAFLKRMKDARSTFRESEWPEIKRYCHIECEKLSNLFKRLRQAHKDAGIPLSSFFGAGSTASVLLRRMGVRECLPKTLPIEVESASASAFFGGRFEVSRVGPYEGKIYSYDIASAYPYQAYRLPCLACGNWFHVAGRKTDNALCVARFALVRYSVHGTRNKESISRLPWGPFPFRCADISGVGPFDSILDDGSIVYPAASGGGWTYLDEYLEGSKHWKVKAHEAWIYETQCDHHPFKELGDMYIERLRLGKEGAGIVLKLGINSCYGKLAQSLGKPIYRCPLWAGAITSGCRAQLLSMIAQDPEAILSVATDGLVSTRPLKMLAPEDTGTHVRAQAYGKVGLGGWEEKTIDGGIMLIRPGIAFALTGKLDQTKARGVGRSTLDRHKDIILDSWKRLGPKPVKLEHVIFRGAKSSITESKAGFTRSPQYGQWVPRETVISYNPEPKRPFHTQPDGRLSTWAFDQSRVSAPYDRMVLTPEVAAMVADRQMMREQPDMESYDDNF